MIYWSMLFNSHVLLKMLYLVISVTQSVCAKGACLCGCVQWNASDGLSEVHQQVLMGCTDVSTPCQGFLGSLEKEELKITILLLKLIFAPTFCLHWKCFAEFVGGVSSCCRSFFPFSSCLIFEHLTRSNRALLWLRIKQQKYTKVEQPKSKKQTPTVGSKNM